MAFWGLLMLGLYCAAIYDHYWQLKKLLCDSVHEASYGMTYWDLVMSGLHRIIVYHHYWK